MIDNQPIINLGCLGCVSDGKSTLIKCLTGIKTQRHSQEKDKNISIKQGYANLKIYDEENNIKNHISFVDCPGHQDLILTLLTSLCLMDGVIIIIAINNPIKTKTQLKHQLLAVKLLNIKNIIVCLNKIDLENKKTVMMRKLEVDELFKLYNIKPNIIIPTSFNKNIGLDNILYYINEFFKPSDFIKKTEESPLFSINRSFDINKPGVNWDSVQGGVLGGTLLQGKLKINDKLYITPGINNINNNGQNLFLSIISIKTENISLDKIIPGGLIGIGTDINPFLCKDDNLKGALCSTDNLPLYNEFKLKILNKVNELSTNKVNLLILSYYTECEIIKLNDDIIKCQIKNKIHIPLNYNIIDRKSVV